MIKLILKFTIDLLLFAIGSLTLWEGLITGHRLLTVVGIILLLSGVALGRFRFWSNLMK